MPGSTGSYRCLRRRLMPRALTAAAVALLASAVTAQEQVSSDGIIVPFQTTDVGAIYLGDLKQSLDAEDRAAVLRAVGTALDEVTDGASYVWTRANGRLTGVFQPIRSFRSDAGETCRHLVITLTSGAYSKRTEGMACRQSGGTWTLG